MKADGSEIWTDEGGSVIINESAVADNRIMSALYEQHPEVASIIRWGQTIHHRSRRGGLFDRDRYLTPDNIFDEMRVAYSAADNDDIVSGVMDVTEGLAFNRTDIECEDPDQEDVLNQIAADLELDARLREMWRDLYTVSQFACAVFWGTKTYKVRGRSDQGVSRKKVFKNLKVPIAISILDPIRVVPVGSFLFGQERLAYHATDIENRALGDTLAGRDSSDIIVRQLLTEKYLPDQVERARLGELNINPENLWLFNSDSVWRHTLTRASYERYAKVRLKSVFELLDLKSQLREMDRAHLLGATSFIVLIKKGTDALPAKPREVTALSEQFRMAARVPVIVGDHRLSVEIVTPKTDHTLEPERYNGIDSRIASRLYGMFFSGGFQAGAKGDDSIKLARVVARGIESRRHMLRRAFEKNIFKPMYVKNDQLTSEPNLMFHPKRVALDFDPAMATFLQDLRDRGDLSRESILDEVDFDQDTEARKREAEAEHYDSVFQTTIPYTAKPGGTATPSNPKAGGRRGGGNKGGGGSNPDSSAPNSNPVRPKKPTAASEDEV